MTVEKKHRSLKRVIKFETELLVSNELQIVVRAITARIFLVKSNSILKYSTLEAIEVKFRSKTVY